MTMNPLFILNIISRSLNILLIYKEILPLLFPCILILFVEKGGRIKIACGIYLELPVWLWVQAQKLNMLKISPEFLMCLRLNNCFSPQITFSSDLVRKNPQPFPYPYKFPVHNACQEAAFFTFGDSEMICPVGSKYKAKQWKL